MLASDGARDDLFGYSVAVSGDTVAVGARFDNDNGRDSGSAYVFERDAGGVDNWGQVKKLLASDGAAQDAFGDSIAVSGDTVVVGARLNDDNGHFSGSAYIFERNKGGSNNWGEVTKLLASDGATNDFFGSTVAVSVDTAVVGAHSNDDNGSGSGSAHVFERDAGGVDNWGEVTKMLASDAAANDLFGGAVAVSVDTVVVISQWDDDNGSRSGSAYVFAFVSSRPLTSNVTSIPNPASVAETIVLSAKLDDTDAGGSTITSAEYEIRNSDGTLVASGTGDNTVCPSSEHLCPVFGVGQLEVGPNPFDAVMESVAIDVPVGIVATLGPGVYEACVRGTDADRNMGTFEQEGACTLIVIYDPNGSFVTGGGWITSPAGAYKGDETLSGKANFGFVSKYKKGTTVPTGNTQFQFDTVGLEFKSSEYEWLVVAGALAQHKGSGTINDTGDFGFLLTAKDSAISGGPATDTFRIKIWEVGGSVVYDNGTDQAIDGGNIKIHIKK